MILDGIVIFCVLSGLFFFFGTSVGLLRFPGFYTRMHAAGKGDTLSSVLLHLGCAIFILSKYGVDFHTLLVASKVLLVVGFIFMGSPTATHAIMDAGYETEIDHWKKGSR
jgi:multicomponent Na+:H+ antiporter subunit G